MSVNELDIAYDYLKNVAKDQASFQHVWEYVKKECDMSVEESESRVSKFFTNFMLDGRFVPVGDNIWDLRERQTFDKVHIDMRDVYNDVDTYDEDEEEQEEYAEEYGEEEREESEPTEGEDEEGLEEDDEEREQSPYEDDFDFNI